MKIFNFFLLFLILFTVNQVNAQVVKIICVGNSFTQGSLDTAVLKPLNYDVLKSWRYPFWHKLDSAGVKFDMIGSRNKLNEQNDQAALYPKSPTTSRIFDSTHEARWGASTDSIKKALRVLKNKDTADIALLQFEGAAGDTNINAVIANIDTIITLLRAKNSYISIFLANLTSGGAINDSISALVTRLNKASSPVIKVDLETGWDAAMTIDGTIPDSTGEKFIAKKFYDALMSQDLATTVIAPYGVKQTCMTIHTICVSWTGSLTPSVDVFSGYDIYANNIKMNKSLIKTTSFNISNLDIITAYNIKIVAVDTRTNNQKTSSTFSFSTDGFKVDFIVKYKGAYVKDAKIVFNSDTKMTGTYGEATFSSVAPGKRGYTVTKAGLDELIVNNQNIQSDTTFYVNLTSADLTDASNDINVFPNPSKGMITIQNAEGSTIEFCDLTGAVLESTFCKSSDIQWNIGKFKPGTYLLTIKKGEAIITKKIILTN